MTRHSDNFWAGGFLYDRSTESVFLHKRDGKTPFNPHKWAFFGGQSEPNESHVECFVRELEEEIGLRVRAIDAMKIREYMNTDANQYRVVFYVESAVRKDQLVLGEGAGFAWIELSRVCELDLAQKTRDDLEFFLTQVL
jgi:8-oxo-dGTP pyrophosphatase MutT (NUDIX family)